jgi:predicted O-methyltransferase YrrM
MHREHMAIGQWEGQSLAGFVSMLQPKKLVEVGTLAGGSALWFVSQLKPGSIFYTLEKDPQCVHESTQVLSSLPQDKFSFSAIAETAPVPLLLPNDRVQIVLVAGDANLRLQELAPQAPFDLVFLDGAKGDYPAHALWAQENLREGGLLLADNVLLGGEIFTDQNSLYSAAQKKAMLEFQQIIWNSKNFMTTIIPFLEGLSWSIRKK